MPSCARSRLRLEPRVTEEPPAREATLEPDREWGVPPFEPFSIRTAEFERVPVLDGPMMVQRRSCTGPSRRSITAQHHAAVLQRRSAVAFRAACRRCVPEASERPAVAAGANVPMPASYRKSSPFACAPRARRAGPARPLMAALELHGLAYGRYQVFHRKHVDGRSLFCVASLIEPGTFDVARMASEEFRESRCSRCCRDRSSRC